jgi:sec-independent protein translocase protein TatA
MGLDNPIHIFLLLLVVLLVFGAKRIPEIGRSLGDGMRSFKDSIQGDVRHDAAVEHLAPAAPTAPAPALVAYHLDSEPVGIAG